MTNAETTTGASSAAIAEQGAHVAPEKPSSKKAANQKKGAPKARKTAKAAAPKKEARAGKKAPKTAAEGSNKKAEVTYRGPVFALMFDSLYLSNTRTELRVHLTP